MRITTLVILLFASITTFSQNCDNILSGYVVDEHDGSKLVGATLIIAGSEETVQTDFEGRYEFNGLCDRSYSIQVYHPYCLTQGYTVKISGNTKKTFRLEHHLEELQQITVEGKAFGEKTKTLSQNTISDSELDRFSGGSLGDALNSLSGVSSLNTGNSVVKPLINGLHSSRVVIINNGVRMEDQEWGSEHAPNIDINATGNLTLIKGAGALQYGGDAVGGVIVAEAAKVAPKDSLFGKTMVSGASNGRGATITTELTKSFENGWFAKAQGTVKRFGDFESPDYILSNTGTFERNLSLQAGFNRYDYGFEAYYSLFKNELGILRASHLGGTQDQVSAINSDRPLVVNDFTYSINEPKQDVTHNLARFKGFKRFNGFGKISLQYDFQRNNRLEYDIRRGDDRGKASLDLQLDTHTLMADVDNVLSEKVRFKWGLLGKYQNNFANPDTGVRRLIPDYDKYELGIYAIVDYNVNDNLLIEAGGRFDYSYIDAFKFYRTTYWESRGFDERYPEIVVEELDNQILTNPQLSYYNPSATLGATYMFGKGYKLYFNYSLASRAPNPSELFSEGLHHSASRFELGDLSFDSEVGHKIAITLQRENERFNFSLNPYINTINDFMVIEPVEIQQTVRGNFQVWEYRQTNAQLLGVDFDASLALVKNLRLNSQFSFVKGYDRIKNEALINMPPVSTKNELEYVNPSINNLRIALQSDYVFRQNEYPNTNFAVFIPETETMETVDLSTPPPAYHLLNLSSSIDIKVTQKSTMNIGLGVTNLMNVNYRNYLNRLRYYADDLGRNILLNLKFNY